MGVKDKIQQIAYNESLKTGVTIATVLSYDFLNNIAKIVTNTNIIIDNVPIANIPGIHQSSLQPNDTVYVIFVNNSISNPKIISKADELYAYNSRVRERHLRKGELSVQLNDEEGEIQYPSSSKWIETDNKKANKYGGFYDMNAIEDADTEMYSLGKFNGEDVGIYNPKTSSLIKIKDDGTINIFTETNNGIRISPKDNTIEILGNNLCIDNDNWTISSRNINIKANESLSIETKNLKINADNMEVNNNV